MSITILGIRHHGVGSARNVKEYLELLKPDLIIVEGPPEITDTLLRIGEDELVPPVAIMVYNDKDAKQSTFYPFAEYSPEWVAAEYANKNKIPLRSSDLPVALAFKQQQIELESPMSLDDYNLDTKAVNKDPLSYLANIAGYESGEQWWEHQFEEKRSQDPVEHFEAVMLSMTALREANIRSSLDTENVAREAYMRESLRQAQNEMYSNIVFVCGAWHAPVLNELDKTAKADAKIIKSLGKSKVKITSTWIPWTNSRLSMTSGYGAGIQSPGWSEHLWKFKDDIEMNWLTHVAETFREKLMDISTAHVIESYRLAESLSAIRNISTIRLQELNEATQTVMCMGDAILLDLIKDKLVVGHRLGEVPNDIPKVPLQSDFEQIIKKLRLKLTDLEKQVDLDLRKETGLQKSILFHRLEILELPWAERVAVRTKGTFKESWLLEWTPELMILLIDKAYYGNTVELASQAIVKEKGGSAKAIAILTQLISSCIPGELYNCIDFLLKRINDQSAISSDVIDLMESVPGLVKIARYGNVRQSDLTQIEDISERLFLKIFFNLSSASYGLDEDSSNKLFDLITKVNNAIRLYDKPELKEKWLDAISNLLGNTGVHPIILGCVSRLLLDAQRLSDKKAANLFSYHLSANNPPNEVAAWLEGFLKGSGMILIYDNKLWNLLYNWILDLPHDVFMEMLPILRRTMSQFEFGERRQIGEKAKQGVQASDQISEVDPESFNHERALAVLPTIINLLGPH